MSSILFLLVVLGGLGSFAYSLFDRFRLLLAAKPVDRFDRVGERIKAVMVYAFGQKKFVVGEQPAGWMHVLIFWGFIINRRQVSKNSTRYQTFLCFCFGLFFISISFVSFVGDILKIVLQSLLLGPFSFSISFISLASNISKVGELFIVFFVT